jgi:hypothetical protein
MQLDHHGLQAEYVYNAPNFDGDSIWNVFGFEAFNDARLTYDVVLRWLRLYATGFLRMFANDPLSASGTRVAPAGLGAGFAEGGAAGVRVDLGRGLGRGYLRLDGYYEDGYGGTRAGTELAGRLRVLGDWLSGLIVEGRLSYVWFQDDLRTIDHSHSLGFQAGVRYSFVRGITLHLALEENVNRFWASDFRALALLDISFFLGARGQGLPTTQPAGLAW